MNKFVAIPVLFLSSLFVMVSFQNCGKIQSQDLLANQNQALTADGIDTAQLPTGPTIINQPNGMPNSGSSNPPASGSSSGNSNPSGGAGGASNTNPPSGSGSSNTNPAGGGSGSSSSGGSSGSGTVIVKEPPVPLPPVCDIVRVPDAEERDHETNSGNQQPKDSLSAKMQAAHDDDDSDENENERHEHERSVSLCQDDDGHHHHGDHDDDEDRELKEARMHCGLARSKFGRRVLKQLPNVNVIEVTQDTEIKELKGISIVLGSANRAKISRIKSAKGLKIFCDIVIDRIDEASGRMILVNSEVRQSQRIDGRADLINSRIQDISKSSCEVHKLDR